MRKMIVTVHVTVRHQYWLLCYTESDQVRLSSTVSRLRISVSILDHTCMQFEYRQSESLPVHCCTVDTLGLDTFCTIVVNAN